ncbi:MAG: GGDEF domain-containing protein [Thermoleophilaceae bacterium]|nr:GGDEF domain-containing protein [Thermoleophilaceae bacterium]
MITNHRSRIATALMFFVLLVIPATVPAFASGEEVGTVDAAVVAAVEAPAEVAPVPEPVAKTSATAPAPRATVAEPEPEPEPEPEADTPSDDDPTEGPSSDTGATGATGATGPSGPEAGGGADNGAGNSNPPAEPPAPSTGSGTPPSGTTEPDEAPRSTGTLTDEVSGPEADKNGNTSSGSAGENATSTEAVLTTLTGGASAGDGAALDSRSAARRTTDQIQRNAESGVVGSLVVTRIISEIPTWVFWALGALGIVALAGLALFLRERHRRRSAEEDAMVDELTGISNRKAFDRRLDLEWRRAARYGRSLGLMVMDLDGFKQVNDLKGHAAGDALLHDVAQALHKRMRDTDLVARIGGDEFAVICPETGINELMTIRRQLSEQTIRELKEAVGLSIGVAEYVPSDDDATSILARADESMYRVKRGESTALPA